MDLDRWVRLAKSAWVFEGPTGTRPTRNFHTIWSKTRAKAGIPDLHLHDLRHTGNALAAETGATLRELMDRMGHASTGAALIYLHAREERDREIAHGIEEMVNGGEGARGGHDTHRRRQMTSTKERARTADPRGKSGAGDGNRSRMTSLEDQPAICGCGHATL